LAGTIKQYSKKAMAQLAIIAFHKGTPVRRKCPYQANVIKIFDSTRRKTVRSIFIF